MKRILILVFLCAQSMFSQTEKGNLIFSGNTNASIIGVQNKNTMGSDASSFDRNVFNVSLMGGYFVENNFFVALSSSLNIAHWKYQNSEQTDLYHDVMPKVGYYFPVSGNLRPFVMGGVGYAWTESENEFQAPNGDLITNNFEAKGVQFSVSGGASYFLSNFISLDAFLEYRRSNLDAKNVDFKQQIDSFGLKIGFSVFF